MVTVNMRTAAVLLLLATCAVSVQSEIAEEGSIARPKGRPPTEAESPELPPYPEHAPPRPAGAEYEVQEHFWLNDNDGKQQWEDPTIEFTEEDGSMSYIDPSTGQSTDVKPVEAAWLSMWDEEYEHEFFYNDLTDETTWAVPYYFAWHKVWVDEDGRVIPHEEDEDGIEMGELVGEGGEELPDWDASGNYGKDGVWEGGEDPADAMSWHDEGAEAGHQLSEEELAEEAILSQEEAGSMGEL